MTISRDDAREALAMVAATEKNVMDYWERRQIGPGLAASGWVGFVGFGSQSRLAELWMGGKMFTGWSGVIVVFVLGLLLPVLALRPFWRPIMLKSTVQSKTMLVGGIVQFCFLMIYLPLRPTIDQAEFAVLLMFSYGIGLVIASMLWLGRWYAFAGLALILSFGAIHIFESVTEIRFTYLALLSGLVLLPAGIWMIQRDRHL